jgi:predicted dehydrogenase
MTEEEIRRVVAVAKKSDKVFLVGSNAIFHKQMQMFKKMIGAGELGDVYMLNISRVDQRMLPEGWLSQKKFAGGGMGMENGSHNIEWALYLLGDPKPVSITARTYSKFANPTIPSKDRKPMDVEDCCLAFIQFDNGCTFIYDSMRAGNMKTKYEVRLLGDRAGVFYDVKRCYKEKSDDCIRIYSENSHGVMTETAPIMKCGRSHSDLYKHFFECIHNGKQSFSNGDRSIVVMRIIDAMYKSTERGGQQIMF